MVVLRLTPNRQQPANGDRVPPVQYRKKPPSQVRRDEQRRQTFTKNKISGTENNFEVNLFESPPLINQHENSHDTQCTVHASVDMTPRSARDSGRADNSTGVLDAARPVIDLDTESAECVGGRVTDTELCSVSPGEIAALIEAEKAGYDLDTIKDYVGTFTDRTIQRRLRDPDRNKCFINVVESQYRGRKHLVGETDDFVFAFYSDGFRYWFVKQNEQRMPQEERRRMMILQKASPLDRERYKEELEAGEKEMRTVLEAMRVYLG